MSELSDDNLLEARLHAIADAQRRARLALLLSSLACGAILAAEWNSYLSWDRQWTEVAKAPAHWAQQQVLAEQVRSWLETNTVSISLIGLRLSVSDAAVLGSVALLVFSYYLTMSLRRENHEVGSLLRDMGSLEAPERAKLLILIRSTSVLSDADGDEPILSLTGTETGSTAKRMLFARVVLGFLTFLPVITVGVVVLSDVYFALVDISPQRQNFGTAWAGLSDHYRWQLRMMDAFALIVGALIFNFCRYASVYRRGTETVLTQFATMEDRATDVRLQK